MLAVYLFKGDSATQMCYGIRPKQFNAQTDTFLIIPGGRRQLGVINDHCTIVIIIEGHHHEQDLLFLVLSSSLSM